MTTLYDFDDVLIEPIPSDINSRNEVDISVKLSDNFKLEFPLIVSPMRDIVNANFATLISDLGGIAILHKFYDTDKEWFAEIMQVKHNGCNLGISIGLNDNRYEKILDEYHPDILLVDLANGYISDLLRFCKNIKNTIIKHNYNTLLMSGNVATWTGANNLKENGIDIVRYGIGGGALCSTRNVTGIGYPSISSLTQIHDIQGVKICADGGVRSSGDFVKAIVAGAHLGMAGSLFAKTFESPNEGTIYGMASRKLNELKYTQIKSIEGLERAVKKEYSLKQFVNEFSWGIKSAGTYLNARNLDEIRKNGRFIPAGTGSIKKL